MSLDGWNVQEDWGRRMKKARTTNEECKMTMQTAVAATGKTSRDRDDRNRLLVCPKVA